MLEPHFISVGSTFVPCLIGGDESSADWVA
jgi:hypothetical protein